MNKESTRYHFGNVQGTPKLKTQLEFDRETQEAVWSALEAFAAPELEIREQGFSHLLKKDAARKSPLVVYVLASRLLEPDLHLRRKIVRCLAALLSPEPGDPPAAGVVLTYLQDYLTQMRKRPIFALLQVADSDPESAAHVGTLLKACSFAGNQLAQILSDHSAPVPIRRQAISYTSRIGFLVAIPALERLQRRLEARRISNEVFLAADTDHDDEASLLPYIREALDTLKSL